MRNIKFALWLTLLALSVAWLAADTFWLSSPFAFFPFRNALLQYSGVMAIGAMSLSMLLAARPVWLERHLNGLDKMYRLHKWLGITALLASVLHWAGAKSAKWVVAAGWLQKPVRPAGLPATAFFTLEQWFGSQRKLAEDMGEFAFKVSLLLLVLALLKWFPYRLFAKTHKLLAAAYLVLVYHSVVLLKFSYWAQPVGWLTAALLIMGSISAVVVLLGRTGIRRKVLGTINALQHDGNTGVLSATISLPQQWAGHKAGQFVFLTTSKQEGAHPYTIASGWSPASPPTIRLLIKALGDHTSKLHELLEVGMPVTVEGPYGCFTFHGQQPAQIWVGGGIGITPFMARMQELAQELSQQTDSAAPSQQIDLFYCTSNASPALLDELGQLAQAARVRLHVFIKQRDGRLKGAHVRQRVPDWQQASLWFCGPDALGQALLADFTAQGWPASRFHQELFAMR